eukprot:gene13433-13561_t
MGKGAKSSEHEQQEQQQPVALLSLPQYQPFLQDDFNAAEFTSHVLAASTTSAQAQAEELKQGVRQLEQALSAHVLLHHQELLQHARRLADTEQSLQDVVLSVSSLQASVKRIRAEIKGPYEQVKSKTCQLRNMHATIEALRHLIQRLKLVQKLKQQMAAGPAVLDLAKAAKLLTDIQAVSKEADLTGVHAAEADDEFLKTAAAQIQDQAQAFLIDGMESQSQAKVGGALQVFFNLEQLQQAVDSVLSQHLHDIERSFKQSLDSRHLSMASSSSATTAAAGGGGSAGAGGGPGGARGLVIPTPGASGSWQDKLWQGLRGASDTLAAGALAVWHLQRVVAKKRDPLSHVLFLDVVCHPGQQLLTERFWSEALRSLSDVFAAAARPSRGGFVRDALTASYPRLVGLLEGAFNRILTESRLKGVLPAASPDQLSALLDVSAPFREAYLAAGLARMQEAVGAAFLGSTRAVLSPADVQKCIGVLHEELKSCGSSSQLAGLVGATAGKALRLMADKAEYMSAAGPELRQFYLEDDRLCYCQADAAAQASAGLTNSSAEGVSLATTTFTSGLSASVSSTAALAAGHVKYIALDRIPARPLPVRQHELDPMQRSHPDVGVAIIDARVLTGQPAKGPKRAVFSLVAGSHTHYLAAETLREAQIWVSVIRETWLHCFSHTARATGTISTTTGAAVVSQRLIAENTLLRESVQELNVKVSQSEGEYWRKWVEEKAKNSVLESQLVNVCAYEISVKTGNLKGAGTDARCYLELFGSDYAATGAPSSPAAKPPETSTDVATNVASTFTVGGGEIRLLDLDSAATPFKRGATDLFTVLCQNIGLPTKLKVWHDNTGKHPDWFLAEIKARKKGTKDWVTFPCNRWLSTDQDDGRICRELVAGHSKPQVSYKVLVHTSDCRGAGTDANVFLQLHGLLGDGLKQQLLGGATAFDRGARNEFTFEDADLGQLTAVTVSHDSSGKSPAWHLDHITVTPLLGNNASLHFSNGEAASSTAAGGSVSQPMTGSSSPMSMSLTCAAATLEAKGRYSSSYSWNAAVGQHLGSTSSDPKPPSLRHTASSSATAVSAAAMQGSWTAAPSTFSGAGAVEGPTSLFPCNAWLDERLGDGTTARKLYASSCLSAKVWYKVAVVTSDLRGAGTDADVSLTLVGAEGTSQRVQLPSNPELFERGSRDEFRLHLSYLGKLHKLLIGHNNKGEGPSWHLSLVEVLEEDTGAITFFGVDRWLGEASPDGLSEITITASNDDPRKSMCEYQVCFITSSLRGAGTNSSVSFDLKGDRGGFGPVAVAAGREAFERGGSDAFSYNRPYLGSLQQLNVWHNNDGAATGQGPWHLEAVVVTCSRDQQVVTFPCGQWLSAETQLRVQLTPGQVAGLTRYRFDVVTSAVRGAGTDGAVLLELVGFPGAGVGDGGGAAATEDPRVGHAGPWCLDRPGAFCRGQTDVFLVEGLDVGSPAQLKVTLQGADPNNPPAWHVSHITCTVLEGEDDSQGDRHYFNAERWLDSSHGMTAVLAASRAPPYKPGSILQPYAVHVFTSDVKGAGTDSNVSINLMGVKDSSGWQELRAKHDTFERGQEDSFILQLPDLGMLTHLGVRSDGSGAGAAWHLDKLCIIPPAATSSQGGLNHGPAQPALHSLNKAQSAAVAALQRSLSRAASNAAACSGSGSNGAVSVLQAALESNKACSGLLAASGGLAGQPVWFVARRWLDAAHGWDVLLEAQGADPAKSLVSYHVQTFTSDVRNAGTDARVYLQLFDEAGASSTPLELCDPSHHTTFGRGCQDGFVVKLPQLGRLSKARVYIEQGRAWHLELLVVTGPDGSVTYFPCGAWLGAPGLAGAAAGTTSAPLDLPVHHKDPRPPLRDYQVTIRTSDVRGGGTDAQVHIELLDAAGSTSGVKELAAAGPEAFKRGKVDTFKLSCQPLGELMQLRVGHDGTGAHPAWHLLQVEVTDTSSGRTWYFEANCWLDAAQLDVKIERLLHASTTDPLANLQKYKLLAHLGDVSMGMFRV